MVIYLGYVMPAATEMSLDSDTDYGLVIMISTYSSISNHNDEEMIQRL